MTANPTLILTRPLAQSNRFLAQMMGMIGSPFDSIISPVLRIEYLKAPNLDVYAGVIFTSENGVRAAQSTARAIPAYCVGSRTAIVAARSGFVARAAGGTAALLQAMIEQAASKGPLLHLRGAHQSGDLSASLRDTGINATSAVVYEQFEEKLSQPALELLAGSAPVILPLFSKRSAELVRSQAGTLTESVQIIAISDAVASVCQGLPAKISTATTPDAAGILAEISRRMVA